ncbi:MAG: peptidoglycan DD-metalloendopeptidase family protein [Desulfobacterales bacterium]|nr:peptidoglycan DD-metalloendopeptidase family protein [Desulfobacterales bacterium]
MQYDCGMAWVLSLSQTIFKQLILLVFGWVVVSYGIAEDTQSFQPYWVNVDRLFLKKEPDPASLTLKKLYKGQTVYVLNCQNKWCQIWYNGEIYYVEDRNQLKPAPIENNTTPQLNTESVLKQHGQINEKLTQKKKTLEINNSKEMQVLDEINEIDLSVSQLKLKIDVIQKDINGLNYTLKETEGKYSQTQERIKKSEEYLAKRLVALYKLHRLGKIQLLASANSIHDLLIRKLALEHILAADMELIKDYAKDLQAVKQHQHMLTTQKTQKQTLERLYQAENQEMQLKRTQRESMLTQLRHMKAFDVAAIDALTRAAYDLSRTLSSLNQQDAYSIIPQLDKKAFLDYKGLLKMPVKGKIISYFGETRDRKVHTVTFQNGITIEADRGEPIHAIFSGKILYAGWLRGYGNLLIIDHGNNYYSLYAHVEDLFKQKGDYVEMNEIIATVGDTGSLYGSRLHFEIRHHQKPVDPLQWLENI